MSAFEVLLAAFEAHSIEGIRTALDAGVEVGVAIEGKSPINYLIEMYCRSDRFPDCLRLMIDRGAALDDPRIGPVLLNDPVALEASIRRDPSLIRARFSMNCTFTPLVGVTLLHLAAEYGQLAVAEKLIELGAEVNAPEYAAYPAGLLRHRQNLARSRRQAGAAL
jgi:ankyrin repeat protein